jgi:crotonobetainyl-CoA:carnitine CoA-transferase CaiB-like acyl-CoA transferase
MEDRPLSGVTILEVNSTTATDALLRATCLAGRIAADMGARVVRIKVEAEAKLLAARPRIGPVSAEYAFLYAGKHVVEADAAALGQMLAAADGVFMDRGVMERCDATELKAAAVLSMRAGGNGQARGSEFATFAACGILDLVGDAERAPLRIGGHQLGYAGGLAAYTALVAAMASDADPQYRIAHINLLDVGIWLNWKSVVMAGAMDRKQTRAGRGAEWQVLSCADGWVAVVYRESDWPKVKGMIGDPRLEEQCFSTRILRRENGARLADILAQGLAGWTRDEIRAYSTSVGLPFGPVWSPSELLSDEQNVARGFFMDAALGSSKLTMPRLPLLWNGRPFAPGEIPLVEEDVSGRKVGAV